MGRGYSLNGIERDFCQRDATSWPAGDGKFSDRIMAGAGDHVDDGRYGPASSPKPMAIETALRDHCNIHALQFALIVAQEDGQPKTFTSEGIRPAEKTIFAPRVVEEFMLAFQRSMRTGSQGYRQESWSYSDLAAVVGDGSRRHSSSNGSTDSGGRNAAFSRRLKLEDSDDDDTATVKRKRARGGPTWNPRYTVVPEDDVPIATSISHSKQLRIGDGDEVSKFYAQRFKDLQQSACKVIAKAFVKAIEPKKQTNYPYTKGLERAPPWWPPMPPGGEKHEKCVRHKEPDHLYKKERVQLLVHILRLVINPDSDKTPNIKNMNIRKLEELTNEAMSNWWNEKENILKRPYLKEIFKVAKQEERFRNGEIDGDAQIVIMHGDERSGMGISDDEPDDGLKYDDDEDGNTDLTPTSNMPTPPENLVSPHLAHLQGGFQPRQAEIDPNGYGCIREMPVRSYPAQMDDPLTYADANQHPLSSQQNYNTDRASTGYPNQSLGAQDHNRRPPWPTSGFPGASPMYPGWASSNNNLIHNSSMQYNAFSSALPHPASQAAAYQLPLPSSAPNQPSLPPVHHQPQNFNDQGLVGRSYEPIPPSSTLRSNTVHPHLIPQQPNSFQEYLNDTSAYGQGETEMKDEHIRGQ